MRTLLLASIACLLSMSMARAQAPSNPGPLPPGSLSPVAPTAPTGPSAPAPILPPLGPTSGDWFGADERLASCTSGCCTACGPPGQMWFGADYLMWWTSGSRLPALATAAPATSTNYGTLGSPDTRVLYGNDTVNNGLQSGIELYGGFWLNDCHTCGIEFSFFDLFTAWSNFNGNSTGAGYSLYRPFYNTSTMSQATELATGIHADDHMSLMSGDVNMRKQLCCGDNCCYGYRVDLLAGYRIMDLQDDLEINEFVNSTNPPGTIYVQDHFSTNNVFNGGQVGIDAEVTKDGWILGFRGLVAMGVTTQSVNISGVTVLSPSLGAGGALPGGLLALRTNSGYYSRDEFGVIPDLGLRFGKQITENLRVTVGYEFMYWSDVLTAGRQVDPVINPYYLPSPGPPVGSPSPARPAFQFHESPFFIQGVTFGAELRF